MLQHYTSSPSILSLKRDWFTMELKLFSLFPAVLDQMAGITLIFIVHDKYRRIRLGVHCAVVQLIGTIWNLQIISKITELKTFPHTGFWASLSTGLDFSGDFSYFPAARKRSLIWRLGNWQTKFCYTIPRPSKNLQTLNSYLAVSEASAFCCLLPHIFR